MRRCLDTLAIDGTIVIGEGERDEAPMLYIGEKVGAANPTAGTMTVDIAVDPLEGTNLCATGAGGRYHGAGGLRARRLAARAGLLHGEDRGGAGRQGRGGPGRAGEAESQSHRAAPAARRGRSGGGGARPAAARSKLIADIREAGARIRLISDGDLSAGIAAAVAGTGVHAVMGSGGAPEGVLTAAALRCLNGEILGRLVVKDDAQKERMQAMGIRDVEQDLQRARTGARTAIWCSPRAA